MAELTTRHLQLLEKITELVVELCGEDGSRVDCRCLDDDDDAPHGPLCAWDWVSPILERLSLVPDYRPDGAKELVADVRQMISDAGDALTAHHSGGTP